MGCIKKNFQRNGISLVLLLLISIRLVPFNLLHYHNNKFADFEALGITNGRQQIEDTITLERNGCSFHQFLSLISHNFVFDAEYKISEPIEYGIGTTPISDSKAEFILFEILNKGSPKLA